MSEEMRFCQHCGAQIAAEAEICPKCGVRVSAPPTTIQTTSRAKNPLPSAVLSAIFPGFGQLYNGEIDKGLLFIVLAFFFVVAMAAREAINDLTYLILWIYGIYDAYRTAEKINRLHNG